MKPNIKILILNWNGEKYLQQCLQSVLSINYVNYSIVVIDNNSNDGSKQMVKNKFPLVEYIELDNNYGYSKGYNKYFSKLDNNLNEYILLLNNDVIVDSNILNHFNDARNKYGNNHIYGGKILYKDKPKLIWYAGGKVNAKLGYIAHKGIRKIDSNEFSNDKITDYVTGCCLFTSLKTIKDLKGFDERFNMYGEDVDFCLRAKKIDLNCYYYPKAFLYHHVSASIGGKYSIKKIIKKLNSLLKLVLKYNCKYEKL